MRYSGQGAVSSHHSPEQYFIGTERQKGHRRNPDGLKRTDYCLITMEETYRPALIYIKSEMVNFHD